MIHVLYNPIAGGGTGEIRARELEKRFPGEKMVFRDVRPTNLTVLTRSLAPGDRVILAGGDGTLNHFVNRLPALPEGMDIQASRHEDEWWAVRYRVPFALLRELFGREPGARMRGNFYTCDETIHPHFGSWSPVASANPDFHRPECFGEIEFVTGK